MERKQKEAARLQRLRELEEKRSAWGVPGREQGGGFLRSNSENDVETLTKEGLLDFLQPRPLSPHRPLSRSASARRHRSAAAAADRQLQSYLELFGTDDTARFGSLPRAGRQHHRGVSAWLLSQDDNRELGPKALLSCGKQVTSPGSFTEPISPLARPSAYFNNNNDQEDPQVNDNELAAVSEGGLVLRADCNSDVSESGPGTGIGEMNVNLERCALVPELQNFNHLATVNNNDDAHLADRGFVLVTDLERGRDPPKTLILDTPPFSKSLGMGRDPRIAWDSRLSSPQKEEEDTSTVSSTTCDTPLPLDTPVSNRKPLLFIMDCTETDCSMTLDYSEVDNSPISREGVEGDATLDANGQSNPKDPGSLSSNLESGSASETSASTNEPPASKSTDADKLPEFASHAAVPICPSSADAGEAASDSCVTPEDKLAEAAIGPSKSSQPSHTKTKMALKNPATAQAVPAGRPARTRTSAENQSMRKLVPLTKLCRSGSGPRRVDRPPGYESAEPRRPLRDQSAPVRRGERTARATRHSSLPPEESKVQKVSTGGSGGGASRWPRDQTPRKPPSWKPSAKPVRNIPKAQPEEKMCRSTLRALAQAAASEGGAPQTPTHSTLPSFARNTVASSSRTKRDPAATATDSTPSTPSKSALGRTGSVRQAANRVPPVGEQHVARGNEKLPGSVRRVQSVRASSQSGQRSETPPPGRELSRKSSNFSEKSVQSKESKDSSSKTVKPTWK